MLLLNINNNILKNILKNIMLNINNNILKNEDKNNKHHILLDNKFNRFIHNYVLRHFISSLKLLSLR